MSDQSHTYDPDDPQGLRVRAARPAVGAVNEQRLAAMRARIRPVPPLELPSDPAARELVLEQIVLEAEAHAEQVEIQMGWHES